MVPLVKKLRSLSHFFCLVIIAGILPYATIAQVKKEKNNIALSLFSGYQTDNLRWSIAGNIQGTTPNILSELKWKKLQSIVVGGEVKWNIWKGLMIDGYFSQSYIVAGKVTDTDYGEDNRTAPAYYGYFNSNKGGATSVRLMAGYALLLHKKITVTPWLGYTANSQSLYLLPNDANTPASLKSTYATTWNGAVAGIDLKAHVANKVFIQPSILYYQIKYTGKADWNLISIFQHPLSFKDVANGFSIQPSFKISYQFAKQASVYFTGEYFYWDTGKGTDDLYLSAGPTVPTQFNEAERNGFVAAAGISISF